jgi:hypothetical protein
MKKSGMKLRRTWVSSFWILATVMLLLPGLVMLMERKYVAGVLQIIVWIIGQATVYRIGRSAIE